MDGMTGEYDYNKVPKFPDRLKPVVPVIHRGMYNHMGKSNPVTSKVIEARLGMRGEEVRTVMRLLRRNFVPICEGPKGYYMATTRRELQNFTDRLRRRFINGLVTVRYLRRCNQFPPIQTDLIKDMSLC
jgi:hypothetical protein